MSPSGAGAPALVMLAAGMAKRYGGCKPLAPLGVHGEAIIDLTASDALAAGFGRVVLVLGPKTSPAMTYHVERTWPRSVETLNAEQTVPLGTAHAVLCARSAVGDGPFAVVNSDDVYGVRALRILADSLASGANALVAFRLAGTVLTDDPVTRGVCLTDASGHLSGLSERRKVTRQPDGSFIADDGLEPKELPGDALVSMNLWGFQPGIWGILEEAVLEAHPEVAPDGTLRDPGRGDAGLGDAGGAAGGPVTNIEETLLPEVVGRAVSAGTLDVSIEAAPGRSVGVTHAADLPIARAEIARMVGRGERSEWLWKGAL
jgi:CTP:molybdopterin cytidylyltransferase MocA